jgi:Flp pilus assembly protein TadG
MAATRPTTALPLPAAPATPRGRRLSGEQGAILVHVAVAFVGLLAFSVLTVDLGVLWVARAEAQNAADAIAMSGAVSLAYIDSDEGVAVEGATAIAGQHQVWGEPANTSLDVSVGACPSGSPTAPGNCVNAVVLRGAGGGTPLPTVFATLFGAETQSVRALASAKVLLGNASTCLRPLAIPDSWIDNFDAQPPIDTIWTIDDLFALVPPGGGTPDQYVPPTPSSAGSSYTFAGSYGVRVRLIPGDITAEIPIGNRYFQMDLPRTGGMTAAERYAANLGSCNGEPVTIGSAVPSMSNAQSVTNAAIDALILSDSGATWNGVGITGSAFSVSPRLITIALIDPEIYAQPGPNNTLTIRNMVGFFVEQRIGGDIEGIILPVSGVFDAGTAEVSQDASFLRSVTLVR